MLPLMAHFKQKENEGQVNVKCILSFVQELVPGSFVRFALLTIRVVSLGEN